VLAGELAGRLAREELSARGSLEMARQQAALNRLVIEEMEDGVLVVDRRGKVRAANPAARRLLAPEGMSRAAPFQLRGVPAWGALVDAVERAFADAAWPEAGRDVPLQFAPDSHRTLRVRVRFTRKREASASEEVSVLFLEDVRNVQARSRQEKLAAMGRVSAGIAHEIRNPLAAIAQANALLAEDATDPAQRQLTKMVTENVERLKRIVDDVMEVAPGRVQEVGAVDATAQLAEVCGEWAGRRCPARRAEHPQGRAAERAGSARCSIPSTAARARQPARQRPPPRQPPARGDPADAARCRRNGGRVQRPFRRRADPARRRTVFVRALFLDPQPRRGSGPLHLPRALREIRGAHRLPAAAARCTAAQRVPTSMSVVSPRNRPKPASVSPHDHRLAFQPARRRRRARPERCMS
jgi:signal transduction histidine kinase